MEINNTFTQIVPCTALQSYVECYWILKGSPQHENQGKDKVLPYGFPEVGFVYGDGFHFSASDGAERKVPACFLSGQFCQSYYLYNKGNGGIVAIRFKPAGLFELFKIPMKKFTNKIVDFTAIAGEEVSLWADQVIAAPTNYQRIKLIENFLLRKLHNRQACLDRIHQMVELIVSKLGNVTIKELAFRLKISDRQLERKFLEVVGISPKLFARLIRVNYVFKLLRTDPELKWQDIIYMCGYYDQAHFIRDFKYFAGESPNAYMARKTAFSDVFLGSYFK